MRPEGRIIISGFSPISLWGLGCAISRLLKITSWRAKFITAMQVKYQLFLLGFSHVETEKFFYFLPITNDQFLRKMNILERLSCKFKLPFGAAYLIMASKRVTTLTPIKPAWKSQRSFITDDLETATQKYNAD